MNIQVAPHDSLSKAESRPRVLAVEDERLTALHLSRVLTKLGYDPIGPVDNGPEALTLVEKHVPDVILMDIIIQGDWNGIDTVSRIRERVDVPVIYLTANTDPITLQRAKLTHPAAFLAKPFDEVELKNTLEIVLSRYRSEAAQRLYQRAIDASVSAIFIVDARPEDKPIIQVNPAFEAMTGYTSAEAVGRSCRFLEGAETDPAVSARLRDALGRERTCHLTLLCYRKDGTTFWSELTMSPVPDGIGRVTHFVGVQHDVTSLQRLETQLRQAQTLQFIRQSLEGIERVTSIVKAIKAFSHPGNEERMNVNLNHALESTLTVCRNEWKHVANVVTELDPNLPQVYCVPGDLNQTFLNLIVNASHAIEDAVADANGAKGTITVRTRRRGDQVEIQIQDTGAGIPEPVRHRVFDPFFTTKNVGRGTGQGLAIAWSVVKDKHHGEIAFESEMGRGTVFTIRLPVQPFQDRSPCQAA